jgi:hypothetical protein
MHLFDDCFWLPIKKKLFLDFLFAFFYDLLKNKFLVLNLTIQ